MVGNSYGVSLVTKTRLKMLVYEAEAEKIGLFGPFFSGCG